MDDRPGTRKAADAADRAPRRRGRDPLDRMVREQQALIDRLRAEQARRRETEERLQLALDATGIGTFAWHPGDDRTEADPRMLELFGLPPGASLTLADALGRLIYPDDRAAAVDAVARATDPAGTGRLQEEIRIVAEDGLRWLSVTGRVEFAGDPPRPVRMLGTAVDVTRRKRAEANRAYLAGISDDLARLGSAEEILQAVAARTASHLGVAGCVFGDVRGDGADVVAGYGWRAGGGPASGRHYATCDYISPELRDALVAGEALVVADVAADPRTTAPSFRAGDVTGFVAIPVHRDGAWVFVMTAVSGVRRAWRADEVEVLRDVAHRVFPRLERARAETRLRASEARQGFLLHLNDRLRPLAGAAEIQLEAARSLGRHLGASRVGYAEAEPDRETVVAGESFTDGDGLAVGRRYRYDDFFPEMVRRLEAGEVVLHPDLAADPRLSEEQRAAHREIGTAATAHVPLVKGGRLVAVLYTHYARPHVFADDEVALVEAVAERTWAAVERSRAEARLRESEAKYRSLFDTIGEGVVLCELVRDDAGRPQDIRLLDLNAALEVLTGVAPRDVAGRLASEVLPDYPRWWLDAFARVVEEGEPIRFEQELSEIDRWFHIRAYPRGGDRFTALYDDITARKRAETALRRSEERQAYVVALSDRLRSVADPVEIQSQAARILGEHLAVDRVSYAEIDLANERLLVHRDYRRRDAPSVAGWHEFATYPTIAAIVRGGETFIASDIAGSARLAPPERAALLAFGIAAMVVRPLMKAGRLSAELIVTTDRARAWTPLDLALVEETAERTWAAAERARAEAALRESEARFRSALSIETVGVLFFNLDGRVTDANEAFLRMAGYSREELLALDWRRADGGWIEPARRATEELARTGRTRPYVTELARRDGTRWWALCAPRVLTPSGDAVEFFVDVTAERESESRRASAEERFRTVVAGIEDYAIFGLDADGLVTDWTEGAAKVKGYAADEVIGRHVSMFYTPEQIGAGLVEQELEQAAREGRAEREDWRVRKGGERFWVDSITTAIRAPDGTVRGYTKVSRDLTERRRLEEERERLLEQERLAREQAEAATRLRDEFLAIVSHELRTPLAAILLWSRLVAAGKVPGREREAMETIERNAEAQRVLIEDLLDASRMMAGAIELRTAVQPLGPVVLGAVSAMRPAAESKQIDLDADVGQDVGAPVTASVDAPRLAQVLRNLLDNAIKHTDPGGRISVGLVRDDNRARIEVTDTGHGIEEAFLPHVFERFRRGADRARSEGGLGLGLAIARQLVELHGGTIEARSEGAGRGATFTVVLPVAEPAAEARGFAGAAAVRRRRPLAGRRVVVAEDDADTLAGLRAVLESEGALVLPAASGREALDLLDRSDPQVALLLSDLAMPDTDGFALIRQVRRAEAAGGRARVPAVAISAFVGDDHERRALLEGFDEFVAKPVDADELTAILRSRLPRRRRRRS